MIFLLTVDSKKKLKILTNIFMNKINIEFMSFPTHLNIWKILNVMHNRILILKYKVVLLKD